MMRNESSYLDEWLNYHYHFGVDHILLYDNNIDREERERSRKIASKFKNVTFIEWDNYNDTVSYMGLKFHPDTYLGKKARYYGMNKQQYAYNDALKRCKKLGVSHLLKFDIDEFLVGDIKKLKENMKNNVKVRRYDFGSNGHDTRPDGLVIENYYMREKEFSHYKELSNVKNTTSTGYSSHSWESNGDRTYFNIIMFLFVASILALIYFKKYIYIVLTPVVLTLLFIPSKDVYAQEVELLHFMTKSKEEFLGRPTCSFANKKNIPHFFRKDKNDVEDKRALEFLKEIKNKFL